MPLVVGIRTPRKTSCCTTCEERWVFAVFAELERPRLCQGTWQGIGCDRARRRRALGLRRGVPPVGKELDVIGHVDEEHGVMVLL